MQLGKWSQMKLSVSISVMRKAPDGIEEYGDVSSLSEAQGGGWDGYGKDEGEPWL